MSDVCKVQVERKETHKKKTYANMVKLRSSRSSLKTLDVFAIMDALTAAANVERDGSSMMNSTMDVFGCACATARNARTAHGRVERKRANITYSERAIIKYGKRPSPGEAISLTYERVAARY